MVVPETDTVKSGTPIPILAPLAAAEKPFSVIELSGAVADVRLSHPLPMVLAAPDDVVSKKMLPVTFQFPAAKDIDAISLALPDAAQETAEAEGTL